MSYKSEYKKIDIANPAVRQALKTAVEDTPNAFKGWTVIDNEELQASGRAPVKIRMHENHDVIYPVLLKNPQEGSGSYDIGLKSAVDKKQGEGSDLVYDRYLSSVVKSWGEEGKGLCTLVPAAQCYLVDPLGMSFQDWIPVACSKADSKESMVWEDFLTTDENITINTTEHPLAL
jgi:hypothetical protein